MRESAKHVAEGQPATPSALAGQTQNELSRGWKKYFRGPKQEPSSQGSSFDDELKEDPPTERWSMGILNDKRTEEVPGTILLLSSNRNEPLGMRHQPERTSASSLPNPLPEVGRPPSLHSVASEKKRTSDGLILLDPQPEESLNDPLNWPAWRRDSALLSLGFYCMLGGGMTPILAAGFNDVAKTYHVTYQRVALTTGLYMMGLGVGSVIASPTAILFGKRPVYLASAIMFIITSVWCALAPNFANLAVARIFQGISVSPVECLPSATIAEIFFLHERAFRVGIYTLLLLGGKNLIPLVSAAIIQALEWRWVFWIVAMVAGFGLVLLFLFVPETFWDRTPRPKAAKRPGHGHRTLSELFHQNIHLHHATQPASSDNDDGDKITSVAEDEVLTPRQQMLHQSHVHVGFADQQLDGPRDRPSLHLSDLPRHGFQGTGAHQAALAGNGPQIPLLHTFNSPFYLTLESGDGYLNHHTLSSALPTPPEVVDEKPVLSTDATALPLPQTGDLESAGAPAKSADDPLHPHATHYTHKLRSRPPKTFVQALKPWNGRLHKTKWFLVMLRPFVLFAYPSVLWSTLVYSLSVGWLIVLSESVSSIYRNKASYNFSALGTGLVYLSPFIGGVLGTAVAGKVSDIVVRFMSRRNGGVYEPEFRLIMAIPVAVATAIGLMGFGWSAQERDRWIVPTIFFGIISFGCSLGSTTAITFCVDSYRQYAGEALVTLNFSKNIFHGLVFSLFFPHWLQDDGPKKVFLAIGGIQIACLLTTIPMYIFGKRARMMTVRKKWMERF